MDFNYYKDFTAEDFIEDTLFKDWIVKNDMLLNSFWASFLEKFPEQQDNVIEAREFLNLLHSSYNEKSSHFSNDDISGDFKDLLEKEIKTSKKSLLKNNSSIKYFSKTTWIAAASIALLIFSSITYFMINGEQFGQRQQYSTKFGEWKSIKLPDGSEVELNANSMLTIPKDWSKDNIRTVWLSGEAFFKVKKIPSTQAKFIVKTKDLKVEVLGTSFNVNSRFDQTEVFLEEGKVKLDLGEKKENIVPGEFIAFSKKKKKITARKKQLNNIHSSWKNGVLTIKNKKLIDVISEIESVYGVEIHLENKNISNQSILTLSIPVDDLNLTRSILQRTLGAYIELERNNLVIK